MAAITTITVENVSVKQIRSVSAQASTGQTDYLAVPRWARYGVFFFNLTAVAGTTPIFTPSIVVPVPITLDNSYQMNLAEHAGLTGLTAAALLVVQVGPGVTGIADDVTNSATANSYVSLNAALPPIIGLKVLNDRTTGDETYTYTVTAAFRW